MHNQFENKNVDTNGHLHRELNESELEIKIALKIKKIKIDLNSYSVRIQNHEFDDLPGSDHIYETEKEAVFNELLQVLKDVKMLRNQLDSHCIATSTDEKIDEFFKKSKLQDYDNQIFRLLQEVDTINHQNKYCGRIS